MKAFIAGLIVLFSIFSGFAQSEQYCNTDFGFCLEYPSQYAMLTAKGASSESTLFVAEEGEAQIEITGYFNDDNWSLEDIYYMNFEDYLRQNPDLSILEETFADDSFEVLYQENEELHFFRVQRQTGQYVKLSVTLPAAQKGQLVALREQLAIQYPKP